MTLAEQAFIGLAVLGGLVLALAVLDAVVGLLIGRDPDLDNEWDPRADR